MGRCDAPLQGGVGRSCRCAEGQGAGLPPVHPDTRTPRHPPPRPHSRPRRPLRTVAARPPDAAVALLELADLGHKDGAAGGVLCSRGEVAGASTLTVERVARERDGQLWQSACGNPPSQTQLQPPLYPHSTCIERGLGYSGVSRPSRPSGPSEAGRGPPASSASSPSRSPTSGWSFPSASLQRAPAARLFSTY